MSGKLPLTLSSYKSIILSTLENHFFVKYEICVKIFKILRNFKIE